MKSNVTNELTTNRQRTEGNALQSRQRFNDMDWDKVGTIAYSREKHRVLQALRNGPLAQRAIAITCKMNRSNTQRTIRALTDAGLVKILTSSTVKPKIVGMTLEAQNVLEEADRSWRNEDSDQ